MTGAKTFLGAPDCDYVNGKLDLSWARELVLELETFEPDVLLHDGDKIFLGNHAYQNQTVERYRD